MPRVSVRTYPNGKKSYVFRYWHQGRRRLTDLGRVTAQTPNQARDEALSHKLGLRQDDRDPLVLWPVSSMTYSTQAALRKVEVVPVDGP